MVRRRRDPLLPKPLNGKHKLRQRGLGEVRESERPKFTVPEKDNANTAYIHIPINGRTRSWKGYLIREGFQFSRARLCWVYCQHEDGSWTTVDECEWVADRVREMVSGDMIVTVYPGIFLEPVRKLPVQADLAKPRSTARLPHDQCPPWLEGAS